MVTFIIGGSASGKSEYAEQHVLSLPGQRIYIATLEPWDDECRARIRKHQQARAACGFTTLECYRGLDRLTVPAGSNILLDGLGNLVAGELYAAAPVDAESESNDREIHSRPANERYIPDCRGTAAILGGIDHLLTPCSHLTIVADEVFSGGSEYAGDTLRYLREMGRLHRDLARRADRVVEVVCGVPNVLKERSVSECSTRMHEFETADMHKAPFAMGFQTPMQATMTTNVRKEASI